MPERERPTIENLAREAVAANAIKTFRFEGPHDAILFVAAPIHEPSSGTRTAGVTDEVTGAVWLMERLPGIDGGQSRQLLFGSIGFGVAALMTALLAIFVTTEIRSGVNIGRVAATDVGVLLLGESGTGKEVVARTIHENSAGVAVPSSYSTVQPCHLNCWSPNSSDMNEELSPGNLPKGWQVRSRRRRHDLSG